MSLWERLGEHVFEYRTRWTWLDAVSDLLWHGSAFHLDLLCPPDEQSEVIDYANWLREQGDWSLRLVTDPKVEPRDMVVLIHRGSGLLRWGKWVEYVVMERSGAPFDPDLTMEA